MNDNNDNHGDQESADGERRKLRLFTDPLVKLILNIIRPKYQSQMVSRADHPNMERWYEQSEQDILEIFADRFIPYLVLAFSIPAVLYFVHFMGPDFPNQAYGLWLDLVGAVILGRGLITDPISLGEQSSGAYGGWLPDLRTSLAADFVDGIWGILLITTGILAQSVAVMFY